MLNNMKTLTFQHWGGILALALLAFSPRIQAQESNFIVQSTEHHIPRNPCKVFIGVVTTSESGKLLVTEVVENSAAEIAGVQTGDVILQLDGVAVSTQPELIAERNKHQQGDPFTLKVVRNGNEMTINARFKSCTETEKAAYKKKELDRVIINVISPEQFMANAYERRDPCVPFIGVLTGEVEKTPLSSEGVLVTKVLDDTPAQKASLQTGDIILALDGKKVSTHTELCAARDKHSAGDRFQLTVLRDGKTMRVNAQFKACNKPAKTADAKQPAAVAAQPSSPAKPIGRLELTSLQVFPNPTAGPVSVRFEAPAVPTTVRIIDVTGRTVYSQTINQFSGYFNEDIDLGNNRPGIFTLQIEQNGQTLTEQIVLTNRA